VDRNCLRATSCAATVKQKRGIGEPPASIDFPCADYPFKFATLFEIKWLLAKQYRQEGTLCGNTPGSISMAVAGIW
jgi:hypothetical protein